MAETTLWFDAVLYPHRSLGRRAFTMLMIVLGLVSFAMGMAFLLMGAWPVFGFFGLDVLALYLAFRLNYRSGEVVETIRLTDDELVIGRRERRRNLVEWKFQPYWVRIEVDEPRPHENRLLLKSHGRTLAIGSFLTPEERIDLARALRDALRRQRMALAPAPAV